MIMTAEEMNITIEEIEDAIDFCKKNPMIFYDYTSRLIPVQRKPLVNADQLIGFEG